jgi:hypothetical protein
VQDIAGDSFFFATIRSYRDKGWVDAMFLPYTLLFTLAAMLSLSSIGLHGYILLLRCRNHGAVVSPSPYGQGRHVTVAALERGISISTLKSKFDLHRFERWRHICGLLLGLLEDLPMGALLLHCENTKRSEVRPLDAGTMNGLFVTRSVIECIDAANAGGGSTGAKPSICDLMPGQLTLLMLSLSTSAIMLGSKLASVEIVRLKRHEMDRIEAERDTMLRELQAELEASLGSPEEAHEVEKIFAARRQSRISVLGPSSVLPVPAPAPAEVADSNLSAGSQVAICFSKPLCFFSHLPVHASTAGSAAGAPGGIQGSGEKFQCGRPTLTAVTKNRRAGRAVLSCARRPPGRTENQVTGRSGLLPSPSR